jgi:hypothetical protein
MANLTPHAREQLLRVARIVITGLLAQPAIASLVSSTLVRYPLIMAVIAAVEVIYHELTKPKDVVVPGSRPASPPT